MGYSLKSPLAISLLLAFASCTSRLEVRENSDELPLSGTWKLLTGTLIENGDTTITDYTQQVSFIKIINDSHFAFLHHNLTKGSDSVAVFSAGGGSYVLKDSLYTEHLEYCTAREWENHDFSFVITINKDTLTQRGVEVVESAGVNRMNIERYIRIGS